VQLAAHHQPEQFLLQRVEQEDLQLTVLVLQNIMAEMAELVMVLLYLAAVVVQVPEVQEMGIMEQTVQVVLPG
jgi:hypothetical protein